MIQKKICYYFFSVLLTFLVMFCSKNETSLNVSSKKDVKNESTFTYFSHSCQTKDYKSDDDNREMVLGNARAIPYSMANMRLALEFINANAPQLNTRILPTHYQIKQV